MPEAGEALSERELAVLDGLIAGLTNREIASELSISPNTVKVHVRNIFTKLEVSSRTEAATLALQQGLTGTPLPVQRTELQSSQESESTPEALDRPPQLDQESGEGAPRRPSLWIWIGFIVILLAGLIGGAIAGDWLRSESTPEAGEIASSDSSTKEPIGNTRWFPGDAMPQPRAHMALAAVGLDLFLIGGEVDAGVINLVDILETDTGEWLSGTAKPTAVSETTAAVLFGEIYVPGGLLADGRPTAVVESYSPANNAWRPVAPLPTPTAGGLILSDANTLYFFGGWDGQQYLAEGYKYNPADDSWSDLPAMEHARAHASGGLIDDRFYIVGGQRGDQALDVCEYFDLAENAWFDCPSMSVARSYAGAAPIANRLLYVVGGDSSGGTATAEVLDVAAERWDPVETPMLTDTVSWKGLGVLNVESRLFVVGGFQDSRITADSYIYAPLTNRTYLPSIGTQ